MGSLWKACPCTPLPLQDETERAEGGEMGEHGRRKRGGRLPCLPGGGSGDSGRARRVRSGQAVPDRDCAKSVAKNFIF